MPAVLHTLTDRKELLTNEIYLLSAVTALHRVTETLPHFISPYLQDATLQVRRSARTVKELQMWFSSIVLTLPVPAGVSADSARRDLVLVLLVLLVFLLRPAVLTPRLPQEHARHQAAPQGPSAHPHQVLQHHGRGQEGGKCSFIVETDPDHLTAIFKSEETGCGVDQLIGSVTDAVFPCRVSWRR